LLPQMAGILRITATEGMGPRFRGDDELISSSHL
jgi:hypothetical protein